jgi:hypothetical protein
VAGRPSVSPDPTPTSDRCGRLHRIDAVAIDIHGDRTLCGPDCNAFLTKWGRWWGGQSERPVALLVAGPGYKARCGQKTRNMVSKADRLYTFRPFEHNDEIEAMHEINVSRPARQGKPMSDRYRRPPIPIVRPWQTCDLHQSLWWGAFDVDGRLRGYCNLIRLNDLGVVNTILGHGDAAASVNGLIAHMAESSGVRWIHYLTLASSSPTLAAFKRRCGFREYRVLQGATA